jgi:hypothetical protein
MEIPANIKHGFINDEMAAVKHPIDGKYYTSKAKFRYVTKAHGYEEVGTAYENGYEPGESEEKRSSRFARDFKLKLVDNINNGRFGNGRR